MNDLKITKEVIKALTAINASLKFDKQGITIMSGSLEIKLDSEVLQEEGLFNLKVLMESTLKRNESLSFLPKWFRKLFN